MHHGELLRLFALDDAARFNIGMSASPILMLPPERMLRSEIEIKRSRFIASAARATSAEAARAFIAQIRSEFPDARHNCTAFSVLPEGATNPQLHSSDDGEPSGTAGRPMLDVLVGSGLSDVVTVVTRYFGGVLLGTGGLARAYCESVRGVLNGATIVRAQPLAQLAATVTHAEAGRIEAALRSLSPAVTVTETRYEPQAVTLLVACEAAATSAVKATIAQLTAGAGEVADAGWVTVEIPAGTLEL